MATERAIIREHFGVVVDKDLLEDLARYLEGDGGVEFQVSLEDGITSSNLSVQDVLSEPNSSGRRIRKIEIIGRSSEFDLDCVSFSKTKFETVSGILSCDQSNLREKKQRIESSIKAAQEWWSPVCKHKSKLSFAISLVLSFIIPLYVVAILDQRFHVLTSSNGELFSFFFVGGIAVSFVLSISLVEKVLGVAFPDVVFSIGELKGKHGRLKYFHGLLLTAVVIPIIRALF